MAYQGIADLTSNSDFNGRVTASATEQAQVFRNDARGDFVALADACLRGQGEQTSAFVRLVAAAPGLADKATTPDGIDQSLVTDADILSTVQGNWQVVADLYYDTDGTPFPQT